MFSSFGPWGATAEMEKLTFLDLLDEKIDGKSKKKMRPDLTRALETIWDIFFDHFATCSYAGAPPSIFYAKFGKV